MVRVPAGKCRPPAAFVFLFEFLRVSGEGRLISDLSIQRRHADQQRVAYRLAHISAQPEARFPADEDVKPLDQQESQLQDTDDDQTGTFKKKKLETITVEVTSDTKVSLPYVLAEKDMVNSPGHVPKCLQFENGGVFD
ncbi:PREDICTED: uncharacterized protein LOC108562758 [Nicrophorus vespilloides]|uniref:Uncharacterized protein LOC108562758 n=1 Tax=Nicrophorus vespilloides TaxID=110193 RepID=A0ABM1MQ19_NICVS|nr:PREDICTED: uncharacterized protein LOC108562758 [Nicrophorus vespilloides]